MLVRIADVRLFVDVYGSKLVPTGATMRERPTFVLLHGGPGLDHSSLRPTYDVLAELGQVVYFDQRGHGRSDRSSPSSWNLARWADDLRELCDALGIEAPVIVGTSFGGYVAMAYAIKYPQHLAKLVLISTALRGTAHPTRRDHVLGAFERRGGAAAVEAVRRAFDDRTPDAFDAYVRICGPLYTHAHPDPDSAKRAIHNRDVISWFERPGGEGAVFDLSADLSTIACPTLILGGDDDPITPPGEQQAIVEAMRPGTARFLSFARCGHGVWRDQSDVAFRALAEFVTETRE